MKDREALDSDLLVIENSDPNYVEIISANSKTMLSFMQITLRQNDIHFFVKNEMMLQIEPTLAFASTADAAQIFVHKKDAERAIQLLEDSGHSLKGSGKMSEPISDFMDSLVQATPFLKNLRSELQMIVVFGSIAILFAFIAYFILNAFGLAS